jgi:hypothetical protein
MQTAITKKRQFNITGSCVPGRDYMVDTTPMIQTIIRDYVEQRKYFVINRARQYGKTTTLSLLECLLSERCITVSISFEGRDEFFVSNEKIAGGIRRLLSVELERIGSTHADIFFLPLDPEFPMDDIRSRIVKLCQQSL